MIPDRLQITYPSMPNIAVESAHFDGTAAYLTRGAGLTGAADSKKFLCSFWYNITSTVQAHNIVLSCSTVGGDGTYFGITISSGQALVISGNNSALTLILGKQASVASTYDGAWHHAIMSVDMTSGATLYVDDAPLSLPGGTFTNDTLIFSGANVQDWAIGSTGGGTSKWPQDMAEVYFAIGQSIDLSLVSNRRKFRSASGKPVYLGSDGSAPTGTAPSIYLHLATAEAVANFATNRGSGGNFTVHGSLTAGASNPSD